MGVGREKLKKCEKSPSKSPNRLNLVSLVLEEKFLELENVEKCAKQVKVLIFIIF